MRIAISIVLGTIVMIALAIGVGCFIKAGGSTE